jgi:hypothetical protein
MQSGLLLEPAVIFTMIRMWAIIVVFKLSLKLLFQMIFRIVNFLLQACTRIMFDLPRFWRFRGALGRFFLLNFTNFLQTLRSSST